MLFLFSFMLLRMKQEASLMLEIQCRFGCCHACTSAPETRSLIVVVVGRKHALQRVIQLHVGGKGGRT